MLSSRLTFFAKFIRGPLFTIIVGAMVVPAVLAMDPDSNAQPLSPGLRLGLLGFWLLTSGVVLFFSVRLKRVEVRDDGRLYVSNYVREWAITPNDILSVRQNRWVRSRPIRVQLRYEVGGLGSHFVFIPVRRATFRLWREDVLVEELRKYAETVYT